MEKMKRMGVKMTQSRKKAEKALYDKFKSQEKPDMPNAFSPGSIFIKFGNKKIKKIPTVEEMMKMRERKKKAKKKAKKKNWKKISKRHKRMMRKSKKSKKKGGRRRKRTRKKRGGECNCSVGDEFTLKDEEEAHGLYNDTGCPRKTEDGKGIYKITKIFNNYIYFNDGQPGGDDEKNVIISLLQDYFEPLQRRRADTPGGRKKKRRKKRTKKKRRRRR